MENRSVRGSQHDSGVVLGALLIVAGFVYLVARFAQFDVGPNAWPLLVILAGVALVVIAVLTRSAVGLAVPGTILTVVGLILAVQNAFGLWATWSYAWALVFPGAIGLGTAIMGAAQHDSRQVDSGIRAALTGIAMFAIFGLFFEGILHVSGVAVGSTIGIVLPIAVIAVGLALLFASIFVRRRA